MKTRLIVPFWVLTGWICFVAGELPAQSNDRFIRSRFEGYDKNSDGKITPDEVRYPGLVRRFDGDRDGSLSVDEFGELLKRVVGGRGEGDFQSSPWGASEFVAEIPDQAPISKESVLAAARYSASKKGISFAVYYDGQLIYADYPNGGRAGAAHELASGTKSFWGVAAMAAIEDGIIDSLDEIVADTIETWKSDPLKSKITVRHLLDLTSGLDPEGDGAIQVPSYASAITCSSRTPPGMKFAYGPVHFQCFGEFLKRKLEQSGSGEDPLQYLDRRIFQPIGLRYSRWRRDVDGNPNLPSGAMLTATQWAKFGELIRLGGYVGGESILGRERLDQCFVGSQANPAYGLTFWLNVEVPPATRRTIPQLRVATEDMTGEKRIPSDLLFAAGAGRQRLFVSRQAKLVVVRQASGIIEALGGRQSGFSDAEFLSLLLATN